jgi:GH15 family glucan-1,4-alpha-glucosidase
MTRRDRAGSPRIEDLALIGDTQTAALVDREGSIDWLCLPRFDSAACFASLLGTQEHGRFRLAPATDRYDVERRYRSGTLILETDFHTGDGDVRVIDLMPIRTERPTVIRVVHGLRGRVRMELDLAIRFDYGSVVPWVRRFDDALVAIGGPDAVCLRTPAELGGRGFRTASEFVVEQGDRIPFVLEWFPSFEDPPPAIDADEKEAETERWWTEWSRRCIYDGEWRDEVVRSLITLKALTHSGTGGMVAAPTTSLPEFVGGTRNWDYRFSWLRDSTSTLEALMAGGYEDEARAWRDWLLRAVAGDPAHTQIMYGVGGERRLTEQEVPWLPGYEGSSPVRIGNDASTQYQLDVYGEILDAMLQARHHGIHGDPHWWEMERLLTDHVQGEWRHPTYGIWEGRGEEQHYTYSKVMAWVALDRAITTVEEFDLAGPVDRWRATRDEIREVVLAEHFDEDLQAFTQYPGAGRVDASALLMPVTGFLPPTDARFVSTVKAVEERLMEDGFVRRFEPDLDVDALPDEEGSFVACTLWLAEALDLMGRHDDARATFERVMGIANDVGLLAEEWDVGSRRMVGNMPQAFSHQWLVLVARDLAARPQRGRHAV